MSRAILPILAAALILACVGAEASDYSGTYVFTAPGGTITLTLEQSDAGTVRGGLNDGVTTLEEGGPAIANLAVAIQKAGGSVTHGYGAAAGARGTLGGGMYSGRTATGKSILWYPGM